jgi:7-carboxy-7-deazaguanine synthase
MIAQGIRDLAAELRLLGYHVTIETAATLAPEGIACDLASLSPKLLNSAPEATLHAAWRRKHEATRWRPEAVRGWLDLGCAWQFKFVVTQAADVDEIESMLGSLGRDFPRHKVLLMPEGVTREKIQERAAWLGELCKERGYRYAPRLQIELYGNKRGT